MFEATYILLSVTALCSKNEFLRIQFVTCGALMRPDDSSDRGTAAGQRTRRRVREQT